jgi:hypothetical protein
MTDSGPVPRIAPGLLWRLLDDDAVVVSPREGQVRVLNGVGTVVWRLLAEQKGIDDIADYLVTHYGITLEQARNDLEKFMNDLGEREMVVWEI